MKPIKLEPEDMRCSHCGKLIALDVTKDFRSAQAGVVVQSVGEIHSRDQGYASPWVTHRYKPQVTKFFHPECVPKG